MIELVVYQGADGAAPLETWIADLDRQAAAKVRAALLRMQEGNLGDVKPVGGGVSERRIDWGPGYRIYFGQDGNRLIVLLGGGTKKRQQRDIENAQSRWLDYKRRKGA
jgi:putative addiction module killer protein